MMNLRSFSAVYGSVTLRPLEESHRAGLKQAADDPAIWAFWPFDVAGLGFDQWFDVLLHRQASGQWLPHSVFDQNGRAIGQTCYLELRPEDSGVEIGGTWYHPSVHGSQVNPACKYLLLDHAFKCGAERVELKTDATNLRSRAAILKLGGQFEGIFRHHRRRANGTWRDTAWYSILREDWPNVQAKLTQRLGDGL
jgi:N-acetyltransferase